MFPCFFTLNKFFENSTIKRNNKLKATVYIKLYTLMFDHNFTPNLGPLVTTCNQTFQGNMAELLNILCTRTYNKILLNNTEMHNVHKFLWNST
jgi:hypothetical protein